jgi:hypothetical protein
LLFVASSLLLFLPASKRLRTVVLFQSPKASEHNIKRQKNDVASIIPFASAIGGSFEITVDSIYDKK